MVLLAAAALATGCSASAEPSEPPPATPSTAATTTPATEPELLDGDQAQQAFDAVELLDPWTVRSECPGEDWCDEGPATTRLYLGAEQRLVGEWRVTSAQLLVFESGEAAQTWIAGAIDAERQHHDGDYQIDTVVYDDGSYDPGEIGTATVETVGDGPWSGSLTAREYRNSDLDDQPYGDDYRAETRMLRACNAVLVVDVLSERAIFDEVSSEADQMWDPLLETLTAQLPEVCG